MTNAPTLSSVQPPSSPRLQGWRAQRGVLPSALVMCVSACVCACACLGASVSCVCLRACIVVCVRACVRVRVYVRVYVCVFACVHVRACIRVHVHMPCVCMRARMRVCVYVCACVWVSASFSSTYNMFPGTRQAPRPLSHNVGGLFMFIWVWNMLVTYHDVRDLHIHERLYKCMYGRTLRCMSTPLYIHVTHTQHIHTLPYTRTHIHTHHTNEFFTRLFLHQISLRVGSKHPNYSDESAPQSQIHNPVSFSSVWFCFFLVCMCACMYQCVVLLGLVLIC